MKKIVLISLLLIGTMGVSAQSFKENHDFGLALSAGSSEFNASLSWKQMYGVTANNKFKLGYGIRTNSYFGSEKNYVTAPAELTSGQTGPGVFFSENILENFDTFNVQNSQHNSINAAIYIEYDFNEKWGIGFNIDAIGFSFGREEQGTMISSVAPTGAMLQQLASPTTLNLLLISDNDFGMLNSELYGTYNVSNKLAVNAGFTFMFTEYTTNNEIAYNFNNDRFRYKSLMGMLSVNYKPFK